MTNKKKLEEMIKKVLKEDKVKFDDSFRTATIRDYKRGTVLYTSEGYGFRILDKYDDGVWEARGTDGQGDKVVYENEARFYKVKK